ncbi:50S ribosomal protein L19 [Candidatus Gracilibacteria bacterium]|nr:50S ribosomal protein L19 [Candidatus Gracilibacteria bacterium]
MSDLAQTFGNQFCKEKVPELRSGYLVKVHQKIKEGNKERIQVFQGTVTKTNAGHGVNDTFTVRKISEGVGVEKIFPIHSPSIVKIEVLRAHKVRRANLRYLRELSGKALRMKEIPLKLKEKFFAKQEKKVTLETKEEVVEMVSPEVSEEVEKK